MKKTLLYLFIALAILIIPTGITLAESTSNIEFAAEPTPLPLPPNTQPTPIPEVNEYGTNVSFSFANLGEDEILLQYPSQKNIYANFPNEWSLTPGSGEPIYLPSGSTSTLENSRFIGTTFLELHYDFSETDPVGDTNTAFDLSNPLGNPFFWGERPSVEIFVNEILVGSFIPEVGNNQRVQIPIPASGITFNPLENPFNEFDIQLGYYNDGDIFCNYDGLIAIHDDSTINTSYFWTVPYRVLTNLPRPLVSDSFIPEILKIVVSDNPTPGEIKALSNVTSSIARNAFSNVSFEMIPASQANQASLADYNAIIIGSPKNNAYLTELYAQQLLPSALDNDGENIFAYGGSLESDTGVLQIIPSPLNETRTFVTITGENDLALFRASDAFSTPPIGANYQLLLVDTNYPKPVAETTVNEETGIEATRSLFTLADLGYRQRTSFGAGTQRFFMSFYVGRDWVLTDDLSLTINYAHADTIDFNSTNAAVILNGEAIGNLLISSMPKEVMTQEIIIKKESIVKGTVNFIQIEANLNVTIICEEYDPSVYWFTVFDDSELVIPHEISSSALDVAPIFHPTMPFAFETSHLVLTSSNPRPSELSAIANFYNQLGGLNSNGFYDVTVVMGDTPDLNSYPDHNIIMFGLPAESAFAQSINDMLPQPFSAGTNNLEQVIGQTAYQLVPGIQVGVVQSIKSPNNPGRMITLMTGTSEESFEWTVEQMDRDLTAFSGDLFFVEENQVNAFATSLFSQAVLDTMVSETLEEEVFEEAEEDTVDSEENAGMVDDGETFIRPEDYNETTTPFLIIAGIAAIGVIIILYLGTRIASGKRRKS